METALQTHSPSLGFETEVVKTGLSRMRPLTPTYEPIHLSRILLGFLGGLFLHLKDLVEMCINLMAVESLVDKQTLCHQHVKH